MAQIYLPGWGGWGGWVGWVVTLILRLISVPNWTGTELAKLNWAWQNQGLILFFWISFTYCIFLFVLKFEIWVLTKSSFLRVKIDNDYKISIFTSVSIFLLWLGEITHMSGLHLSGQNSSWRHLSTSAIYQRLLVQFSPDFKGRFLGASVTNTREQAGAELCQAQDSLG